MCEGKFMAEQRRDCAGVACDERFMAWSGGQTHRGRTDSQGALSARARWLSPALRPVWLGSGSTGFSMRHSGRLFTLLLIFLCIEKAIPRYKQCPYMPTVMAGPPDLVESMYTGSIRFKPTAFYQDYRKVCRTKGTLKYRTADGSCNHAFNLGAANTPLKRMLPPEYGDSATEVSRMIHQQKNDFDGRTVMLMQWGQFIDHDFALTPVSIPEGGEEGMPHCCLPNVVNNDDICQPIYLSEADTRFSHLCMEFTRSVPAQDPSATRIVPREQLNEATSFIDGSPIYGSSEEVLHRLRYRTRSAFLRMNRSNELLPKALHGSCRHSPGHYCFLAGDQRVNEQPGLGVLHVALNKLHNRIAAKLGSVIRDETHEMLFQETRKVVVAIIQNIQYGEWLPLILGDAVMDSYNLHTGRRVAYSGSVDPRVLNAFSTAAFRFGHSLIPEHYNISGKEVPLRTLFNSPDAVFTDFKGCLKALMKREYQSQKIDSFIVGEVTGHLFEPPDQEPGAASRGLDLVALNIQRGRDHGLPPYNKYRQLCGLRPVDSFHRFGQDVGDLLEWLYDSVDDVDLFTGGLLEPPVVEGRVGSTFACIMAMQFFALKFGDRFFFETERRPEGFTDGQLNSIRNVTMAHVLCFFSEKPLFDELQERCFESPSPDNGMVDCKTLRDNFLDWGQWR